jgi:hypothetical protein
MSALVFASWEEFFEACEDEDELPEQAFTQGLYVGDHWYDNHQFTRHLGEIMPCRDAEAFEREDGVLFCATCEMELAEMDASDDGEEGHTYLYPRHWSLDKVYRIVASIETKRRQKEEEARSLREWNGFDEDDFGEDDFGEDNFGSEPR